MAVVVVTRTEPGASETAAHLTQLGHDIIKAPALEIVSREIEPGWEPEPGEKLIFTSMNGVMAYLDAGWSTDHFAVCVGPATSEAAALGGFTDTFNADGNSDQLVFCIQEMFEPGKDRFVHFANDAAAGEVCRRLGESGFDVRFVPLYSTRNVDWKEVRHAWSCTTGSRFILLVHSAKAANAISRWIEQSGTDLSTSALVAISERSASPLKTLNWHCVYIADEPNEVKLTEALQKAVEAGVSSG